MSSSRTSPSRGYFSRHKSTIDSLDHHLGGLTSSLRGGRETQSEARDAISNSNYLNGNVSKRSRDYVNAAPSSTSKYRSSTSTTGGGATNGGERSNSFTNGGSSTLRSGSSRYSTERDIELPKISERIRTFQSSKSVEPTPVSTTTTVPFKSRFLRSSAAAAESAAKANEEAEEVRPSVSDLRRRYDLNRNHLTPDRSSRVSKEGTPKASGRRGSGGSGDSGDESLSNSRLNSTTTADDRSSNGQRLRSSKQAQSGKDPAPVHRSSSPASTLSSSSSEEGENQVLIKDDPISTASFHPSISFLILLP